MVRLRGLESQAFGSGVLHSAYVRRIDGASEKDRASEIWIRISIVLERFTIVVIYIWSGIKSA